MVRNRIKKSDRKIIDGATMEAGVRKVIADNWSIRSAAAALEINRMTLQRYVTKYKKLSTDAQQGMKFTPNFQTRIVFSEAIEVELKNYLLTASNMHHGLIRKQVMALAYELAVVNNLNCPESWHRKKSAGVDWFFNFTKRHPDLALRKPEGTSLARSSSFNRNTVELFYDNLEKAYKQLGNNVSPVFIYNLDETALTTVHNPPNVIAPKGKKQVGQITSGERETLVTACCFIAANGNSIPPFLIFPRKNFKSHMLHGAPSGSEGAANQSGWMNGEVFINVLQHFQKHARVSVDHKVLLILDNHDSHITISSLNFCKDNGIILLTLPPHTSNKLQPLDRTVYKSLKNSFNTACNEWMISNPGKTISIYQIAELFGIAYPTAFTIQNVTKGFESTGIWPLNRNIFRDDEYLCSYVTDRPAPSIETNQVLSADYNINDTSRNVKKNDHNNNYHNNDVNEFIDLITTYDVDDLLALDAVDVVPTSSASNGDQTDPPHHNTSMSLDAPLVSDILTALENSNESIVLDIPVIADAELSVFTGESTEIPEDSLKAELEARTNSKIECKKTIIRPQDIKPFPKAEPRKGINRKRKSSAILTDSPVKDTLCNEMEAKKIKKELIEQKKLQNKSSRKKVCIKLKLDENIVTKIAPKNSKANGKKTELHQIQNERKDTEKKQSTKNCLKKGRSKNQQDAENKAPPS